MSNRWTCTIPVQQGETLSQCQNDRGSEDRLYISRHYHSAWKRKIEMKSNLMPRIQPFFPDTKRCGPSILERHHFLHALLNLVTANEGGVPVQEPLENCYPKLAAGATVFDGNGHFPSCWALTLPLEVLEDHILYGSCKASSDQLQDWSSPSWPPPAGLACCSLAPPSWQVSSRQRCKSTLTFNKNVGQVMKGRNFNHRPVIAIKSHFGQELQRPRGECRIFQA